LTAHVTFSVGWLGAVLAYLSIAVACLISRDEEMVQSGYFAMELIGWFVIVPLSLGALLTGLVQSLGTEWGLFRYYWIVAKFVFTMGAVTILLLHMPAVRHRSGVAAEVIHAGGGMVVLLATTTLSIYKPWGKIRYWPLKKRREMLMSAQPKCSALDKETTSSGLSIALNIFLVVIALLMAVVAVLHLVGSLGMHSH
jgi:hypothetical protein